MAGALDDFSLLVDLRTPEDLLLRPLYHPEINPKDSKLAEVLAPYHFAEPYPCGLSSCRTPHQSGFLVVTEDKKETNIGSVCGLRIFGEAFSIKANLQAQRSRLKHQLDTLQRVRDRKDELLARIAELFNRASGAKWAETSRKRLQAAIGFAVFGQLRDKARRNETGVESVRTATQEERERHRVTNPGGKPLQFITERIGDLAGLDFLNHYPEEALTELKNKIYALGVLDAKALAPKARKEWVDWAGNIERSFDQIEQTLADALRFFTQANFTLIPSLSHDAKEQARLAQVSWSVAERRIVVKPVR